MNCQLFKVFDYRRISRVLSLLLILGNGFLSAHGDLMNADRKNRNCNNIAANVGSFGSTTKQPGSNDAFVIDDLDVRTNKIFKEDEDAIWIHRLANSLHIVTKPEVIYGHLPFVEGDQVTLSDMAEAERILRKHRYLQDASILASINDCNKPDKRRVIVSTWDKWSMFPTINAGRKAGKNKFSVGFKDDNLMGLGIRGRVKYFDNGYRTGYGFRLGVPLNVLDHSTVSLSVFDNDDGNVLKFGFKKPFYTLNDTYSFKSLINKETKSLTLAHNGISANIFDIETTQFEISYGLSSGVKNGIVERWSVGVTADDIEFSTTDTNGFPDVKTVALPSDREYFYPWIEYQFIENNYKVLTDIYSIGKREDHHFGWAHKFRLGVENGNSGTGLHFKLHSRKSFLGESNLMSFVADAKGNIGIEEKNFFQASLGLEYLQGINQDLKYYIRSEFVLSDNSFVDSPLTLGGDVERDRELVLDKNDSELESIGEIVIRGYPSQYQYGNQRWQTTFEARYYPHIELYRMFEVAWVAFIDAGRAWGGNYSNLGVGPLGDNEEPSMLSSIGVGLRLLSSKSSGRNIIHIDVAHPFTNGEKISAWEIRAQAKHRF